MTRRYADFNPRVVRGLLKGAVEALDAMLAAEVRREKVPGAFELPLAARAAAIAGFDAVIALGAVIRGETDHYEHIAREVRRFDVERRHLIPPPSHPDEVQRYLKRCTGPHALLGAQAGVFPA